MFPVDDFLKTTKCFCHVLKIIKIWVENEFTLKLFLESPVVFLNIFVFISERER